MKFMRSFVFLFLLNFLNLFSETSLTLEKKVGQLLMVHFQGEVANEEARYLIQELGIGGIIYYNWANNLSNHEQVKELSQELQEMAKIPLLIAVDQEGGRVTRIQGLTDFPNNAELGRVGNLELIEKSAYVRGLELKALGVNMNLAPVIDINNNPKNPVIGDRAFGDNPEKVAAFGQRALSGYQRAKIITTLKHFPGHGDIEVDSHVDLPVLNKSREELEKNEFLPFRQLAGQADVIMMAHILVSSIDETKCATLSPKIIDILRKDMGFNGVVITDSMVMQGVLKNVTLEEALIQAVNAGNDIILLGGKQMIGSNTKELTPEDIKHLHQTLVSVVKTGVITEERLNQSVARILKLKRSLINKPLEDKQLIQ